MYIFLEDIITPMLRSVSNGDMYFDLSIYEIFKAEDLDLHDLSQCVRISMIDVVDQIKQYVNEVNDVTFAKKMDFSKSEYQIIRDFHWVVNGYGWYNDYISFVKRYELQFAKKWCDENNIKCSSNGKRRF